MSREDVKDWSCPENWADKREGRKLVMRMGEDGGIVVAGTRSEKVAMRLANQLLDAIGDELLEPGNMDFKEHISWGEDPTAEPNDEYTGWFDFATDRKTARPGFVYNP